MNSYLTRIFFVLSLCSAATASAVEPVYTSLFSNKAIKGYDTVAYFTQGKPVKGTESFQFKYMGAVWLFANADHLAMFEAAPEKYAPQYGGYCAYAVAHNQTASIKPELFTIHDGKLYLNYNDSINQQWSKNKADFIAQANQNWPALLKQ
ncbi:hypothetical protein GCM10008090_05990 [Arenicella chitinivorans]|uniref:YHS domain-containing protein n=1 Tax=Arenicella chitinivorans TaxID=1329800 RepID=A0A918RIE7_9GAMM|nr:YHS domain-containing (seleno)protein [Arenicella chitinivorans]GHA00119.1 hypothetical protein GCM10008090_05990 [Arenicella chitinivorans]